MKTQLSQAGLYFGLSGIVLPIPKYQFPQDYRNASRLSYYATFFNSIEINSSFYKIPRQTTVARWASSVPAEFRFTFKMFREVTHVKDLRFDDRHIEEFLGSIAAVGDRKGCILIQFPPGLTESSIYQLDKLLRSVRLIDADDSWKIAVEFRSAGWYVEEVYQMLRDYACALVVHDMPRSATPVTDLPGDVAYVRLHGPTGNYRGTYSDACLARYAGYVRDWLQDGRTVFVYFNNTAGEAFHDLTRFKMLFGMP